MTPLTSDFSTIKIRVAAVICHDRHVLTLRKNDVYTLPGGNVEKGEDILAALWRELAEETGLTPEHFTTAPVLCAVQDHKVNRPGATPAPRKLHFIFRLDLKTRLTPTPESEDESGHAHWLDLDQATTVHSYPPLAPEWLGADGAAHFGAFDDTTYHWRAPT